MSSFRATLLRLFADSQLVYAGKTVHPVLVHKASTPDDGLVVNIARLCKAYVRPTEGYAAVVDGSAVVFDPDTGTIVRCDHSRVCVSVRSYCTEVLVPMPLDAFARGADVAWVQYECNPPLRGG
jgi:hypothetical protein